MSAVLAARWRSGATLVGPLLRMPNENLVELAGLTGMDLVVLDTEHGPADQVELGRHVLAARAVGLPVLVRVGGLDEVLRVLDAGADGIVVPHVTGPGDAQAAVAATRYPPLGTRGFATYTRAGRYGLADPAAHLASDRDVLVVAMVEDADGVAAADRIAAVEGVDGVLVGPADLSVALGHRGDPRAPEVVAAAARVRAATRAAGTAVVQIVGTADAARAALADGPGVVLLNAQAALTALFTDLAAVRRDQQTRRTG